MFTIGEFSNIRNLSVKPLGYYHEQGVLVPSREVYTKRPGMIIQGHPGKYLTEIQMLITV
jgi:hypothetical protein